MLHPVSKRTRARWLWLATLTLLLEWSVNGAVPDAKTISDEPATNTVRVPFEFVSGRILVSARVNHSPPASVMIDTGYSVNTLSRELADSLELTRAGRITIIGIAVEPRAAAAAAAISDL